MVSPRPVFYHYLTSHRIRPLHAGDLDVFMGLTKSIKHLRKATVLDGIADQLELIQAVENVSYTIYGSGAKIRLVTAQNTS